jgi:hypothetical protein
MIFKNPLLLDNEIKSRYEKLPLDSKVALYDFLRWLHDHSANKAEIAWIQKKAPMAVYWSSIKAWSLHLSHLVSRTIKVENTQ